jgi:hypothetical protein
MFPFLGQILASNVPCKMWKKTVINQSSDSIIGGFAVEKIHQKQGPLLLKCYTTGGGPDAWAGGLFPAQKKRGVSAWSKRSLTAHLR